MPCAGDPHAPFLWAVRAGQCRAPPDASRSWPIVYESADDSFLPGRSSRHRSAIGRPCSRRLKTRRSEEHTSELQSLMRIWNAVFCLNKKHKNKLKCTKQVKHEAIHTTLI